MTRRRQGSDAGAIVFTIVLSALVAVAAAEQFDAWFTALVLAVVGGAVSFLLKAFPGSRFFTIVMCMLSLSRSAPAATVVASNAGNEPSVSRAVSTTALSPAAVPLIISGEPLRAPTMTPRSRPR